MGSLFAREVGFDDIDCLVATLRPADRDEVTAMHGENIRQAVYDSVRQSTKLWAFDEDGALAMLLGVAPYLPGVGVPWALGTVAISPRSLITIGRDYLPKIQALYPILVNYVDARNEKSLRWLAHIGFTIREPVLMGIERRPFHRFDRGFH